MLVDKQLQLMEDSRIFMAMYSNRGIYTTPYSVEVTSFDFWMEQFSHLLNSERLSSDLFFVNLKCMPGKSNQIKSPTPLTMSYLT